MAHSKVNPLKFLQDCNMHGYAKAVSGKTDIADDVMQSVAEKLLHSLTPIKEPKRYLFSAIRNTAIDYLRAEERRGRREDLYSSGQPERAVNCENVVTNQQLLEKIDSAIRELPLLTQYLFISHFVDGTTQQQLAKEHGLHISTVEKRLAKARKHCAKRINV